jgi:hypothetical protein
MWRRIPLGWPALRPVDEEGATEAQAAEGRAATADAEAESRQAHHAAHATDKADKMVRS